MLIAQDRLDDPRRRQTDGIVRCSLALDHLVCRIHHAVRDLIASGLIEFPGLAFPVQQRNATDGGSAPQRDFRVAMLTRDICMDIHHGHLTGLCYQITQPRGIQHRARPEYLIGGQPADLESRIGGDVHGVSHHEENRLWRTLHQRRDSLLHQVHGGGREVHPGLPWFLLGACGNHDHIGSPGDLRVL